MTRFRSYYWGWLGQRLGLSRPGRVSFTVAFLAGVAEIAVTRAHGDREGGAPLVVLALLLVGVVTLDAMGRGVVAVVRRLISNGEIPATDGEIFPRYFRAVSDLVVFEVVRSELEAVLVCAILRDAGVPCMHRVTNHGSGAMDGLTTGGPRAIVVRPEHLDLARRVIRDQRDGPPPGSSRSIGTVSTPPLAHAVATQSA